MFYGFQTLGLRRQMTGNALIEPAVDLCRQMNDLDGHGIVLFNFPAQGQRARVTPDCGVGDGYSMSR